jgi:hypothetical protein
MKKYAIIVLSLALIATATYALKSETLSERVERENRETLIRCLDEASTKSTTEEILQAKNACTESIFTKVIAPDVITKEEAECIKNTPNNWSEDPEMIRQIRECNKTY